MSLKFHYFSSPWAFAWGRQTFDHKKFSSRASEWGFGYINLHHIEILLTTRNLVRNFFLGCHWLFHNSARLLARRNYFEKAEKYHQFFPKKYFFKDDFSTRTNDLSINFGIVGKLVFSATINSRCFLLKCQVVRSYDQ